MDENAVFLRTGRREESPLPGGQKRALGLGAGVLSADRHRVEAWKKALRDAKLPSPGEYCLTGEMAAEAGYAGTWQLLQLGKRRPKAIFSASFLIMTGFLKAMREACLDRFSLLLPLHNPCAVTRAENELRSPIDTGEDRESVNRRIDRWPNIRC